MRRTLTSQFAPGRKRQGKLSRALKGQIIQCSHPFDSWMMMEKEGPSPGWTKDSWRKMGRGTDQSPNQRIVSDSNVFSVLFIIFLDKL